MMVSFPRNTGNIIRLLCHSHGLAKDAVRRVSDNHFTVWERNGRNTPEARVAAELKAMCDRREDRRNPDSAPLCPNPCRRPAITDTTLRTFNSHR